MKRFLLLTTMAVIIGLSGLSNAASIRNEDREAHQIKGRVIGGGLTEGRWVYIVVSPNGEKYFACRFGCELVLEATGSEIQLETDADVVIKNGTLEIK